mgnify:CR=1 FL=1
MAEDFIIPVWTNKCEILGYKKAEDINEKIDTLHIVDIILVNKENKIFITKHEDSLWASAWTSSVNSTIRKDENPIESARRALTLDLGLYRYDLMSVKSGYYDFNGLKKIVSIFHVKSNDTPKVNSESIEGKWVSIQEIKEMINDEMLDPLFLVAFDSMKDFIS